METAIHPGLILTDEDRLILTDIRKRVEDTHWTKRVYGTVNKEGKSQYCLVGMVNNALDISIFSSSPSTFRMARHRIGAVKYSSVYLQAVRIFDALLLGTTRRTPNTPAHSCLENWNDDVWTRKEDVLELIDYVLS